jgi:hypothetical protein
LEIANGNQAAAARLLNTSPQNVHKFVNGQIKAAKTAKSNNRKPNSPGKVNPSIRIP